MWRLKADHHHQENRLTWDAQNRAVVTISKSVGSFSQGNDALQELGGMVSYEVDNLQACCLLICALWSHCQPQTSS